jgi:hypothetical protein
MLVQLGYAFQFREFNRLNSISLLSDLFAKLLQ